MSRVSTARAGGDPTTPGSFGSAQRPPDRYKWVALSNTTVGTLMSTLDASIVIIAMPTIFRGIHLDPLAPGNVSYLLWMVLGYLLVSAVLVVSLGRLGDIFGRVRMYNLGFLIFSLSSLGLSLDPYTGHAGALWLILGRMVQAGGGSMLAANSAAILTDAFPADQRGMALGVNQIAALAGQFLGLVAGGLLAVIDWRAVFWVNVPIGIVGTIWSYRSLRDNGVRNPSKIDWLGSITFTLGCGIILASITHMVQPYGGHPTGWTNPVPLSGLAIGVVLLLLFGFIETRVAAPMFRLALFRIRAFAAGSLAALLIAIGRGGMQFMLIIWLQGVWLPQHGYAFRATPLWAGIYLLPLTGGFLISGPTSGFLSDRHGARRFATLGAVLVALSYTGLLFLPVNFPYPAFALLLVLTGIGMGMFSAPNSAAIMTAIPAENRGAASGMRSTFQNSGTALSIGIFFALMTTGLARSLPGTLASGLESQGVPATVATQVSHQPPVSLLFSAFLGDNPTERLLGPTGVLPRLSHGQVATLTGNHFFPNTVAGPFHQGLGVVLISAIVMATIAAITSSLRGPRALVPRPRTEEKPTDSAAQS